jgi:hypothetical protein
VRVLIISLAAIATSASAQSSVDCNAVKNSSVPVELGYHFSNGTRLFAQSFRDKSGDYIIWIKSLPPPSSPNSGPAITKTTYNNGFAACTESWSDRWAHGSGHHVINLVPAGFPKNFDRRSDATYKAHSTITYDDNSTSGNNNYTYTYKFKSEGTVVVGSCVLDVVHGELDTTDDATGKTFHGFSAYYPELQISTTNGNAEPIADSISTQFSAIEPSK